MEKPQKEALTCSVVLGKLMESGERDGGLVESSDLNETVWELDGS